MGVGGVGKACEVVRFPGGGPGKGEKEQQTQEMQARKSFWDWVTSHITGPGRGELYSQYLFRNREIRFQLY